MAPFRDWLACWLLKAAKTKYEAAELALWDLLSRPGKTKRRRGMNHNEFVDYLHARFQWALIYSVLFGGLTAALLAPGDPGTLRYVLACIIVFPGCIVWLTLALLFLQCGYFENVKHPERIPVGTKCFLCGVPLEPGDRVRPGYHGSGDVADFYCHADCDDPKGINVDWLRKPF